MWRTTVFIRHFQENELCKLLQIIAVADAVVAQRGAETPDFGDDEFGGHEDLFGVTLPRIFRVSASDTMRLSKALWVSLARISPGMSSLGTISFFAIDRRVPEETS